MNKLLYTTIIFLLFSAGANASHPGGTVYADVNGLVCEFCARAIEKVFNKQEAIDSIDVNLDSKVITMHFKDGLTIDEETIIKLINDSGYDVRALRNE